MGIENIQKICAYGTGAMGAGTALNFALGGYSVSLLANSEGSMGKVRDDVDNAIRTLLEHNLITELQAAQALNNITFTTDMYAAAHDADFVIESVKEDMGIKQEVFAKLDKICPPHTIFATNSSALDPTEISSVTSRPDKFVGAHMWNPPHLIKLVEIVPGEQTSQETRDTTFDLIQKIGMKPVHVNRYYPGFIGNFIQYAVLAAAMHLVEEGVATADDVDMVVRETIGRRLAITGPIESAELGGLDTFASIARSVGPHLPVHNGVPRMLAEAEATGNFGAKTGHGFRAWDKTDVDALVARRIANLARYQHLDREHAATSPVRPELTGMPHIVAVAEEENAPAPGAVATGQ